MAWGDWIDVGVRGELLWENTNTSAQFAGQDISPTFSSAMGLLDYKFIMIVGVLHTSAPDKLVYFCTKVSKNDISTGMPMMGALGYGGYERLITFRTNSKIYITDAARDNSVDDNYAIPTKIIGFRNDITDI